MTIVNNLLHICSLNSQGLGQTDKIIRLNLWMSQQKCDILFLQETHFTAEKVHILKKVSDAVCYHSFGLSNSRRVSIWINKQLDYVLIDQFQDSDGRILILNIELDKKIYTLVNVYAPNQVKDRNSFFKKLKKILEKTCLGMLLIGGDFNDILSQYDNKTVKHNKSCPVYGLKQLIKSYKLIDIWRIKHPNLLQFTWKRKHNNNEASRIDFLLIQEELCPFVSSSDIRPAFIKYTDHLAVSIKLRSNTQNKGPGTFKLNNSILQNVEYQQMMEKLICKFTNNLNDFENIGVAWDIFKITVREKTIEFCKAQSFKRKK